MGLRHTGRELALKALYQIDIRGEVSNEDLSLFFESFAAEGTDAFALRLVDGAWRERELIDNILADALEHWSIGRLSRVDHNILRIAVYELLRMRDIPARDFRRSNRAREDLRGPELGPFRQRRARSGCRTAETKGQG